MAEHRKPKELEVTPEMIEAGEEAFARHDGLPDVTVFAIFRAMVDASPTLRGWRVVEG